MAPAERSVERARPSLQFLCCTAVDRQLLGWAQAALGKRRLFPLSKIALFKGFQGLYIAELISFSVPLCVLWGGAVVL